MHTLFQHDVLPCTSWRSNRYRNMDLPVHPVLLQQRCIAAPKPCVSAALLVVRSKSWRGVPQGWARFTTGAFRCEAVEGSHLWPLEKEAKRKWLQAIAEQLAEEE